jgi:hypothetical protein
MDNTNIEYPSFKEKTPKQCLKDFCSTKGGVGTLPSACKNGSSFPSENDKLLDYILLNAKTKQDVVDMLHCGKWAFGTQDKIIDSRTQQSFKDKNSRDLTLSGLWELVQNGTQSYSEAPEKSSINQLMSNYSQSSKGSIWQQIKKAKQNGFYQVASVLKEVDLDLKNDPLGTLKAITTETIKDGMGTPNDALRGVTIFTAYIAGYLLMDLPEAYDVFQHSLQDQPLDREFGEGTSLVNKIKQDQDYQKYITELLRRADAQGLTEFNFNSIEPSNLFGNTPSEKKAKLFELSADKNLIYAIHGVSKGFAVEAQKNDQGQWELKVKIVDEYDFIDKDKGSEVGISDFDVNINDLATILQKFDTLNTYMITIEFNDKK